MVLRILMLVIVALACGWQAWRLGYYLDDHVILWIYRDAALPGILPVGGRFVYYVTTWLLYRPFPELPGLIHLVLIAAHLGVVYHLARLLRELGTREWIACVSALVTGLFPLGYEAIYWINPMQYVLSALLWLIAMRWYLGHLETRSPALVVLAWVSYFLACGSTELAWPLCVVFGLVAVLRGPVNARTFLWPSALFGTATAAAVAIYLYFNQVTNRIEQSGGFVPLSQVPGNMLLVLRSTISWTRRYFGQFTRDGWLDLWEYGGVGHAMLLVLVLATTAWFLWRAWNATHLPEASHDRKIAWYGLLAAIALYVFFVPNLPTALVFPALRSRLMYIPSIGIAFGLAMVLEELMRARSRGRAFGFVAGGLVVYAIVSTIAHVTIQDALRRNWVAQREFLAQIRGTVEKPDLHTRWYFLGKHRLAPTHHNLYILNHQLGFLGPALSNALDVRHPEMIEGDPAEIAVITKEGTPGPVLEFRTPRGAFVQQFDLSEPNPFENVILFGCDDRGLVVYRTLSLTTADGETREFNLPASAQTRGPFDTFVFREPAR